MTCKSCEKTIKENLKKINGVRNVEVSLEKKEASFFYDKEDLKEVIDKIKELGYIANKENKTTRFKEISPYFIYIFIIYLIISSLFRSDVFKYNISPGDNETYLSIFIIGLISGIHCISMCGAINLAVIEKYENKNAGLYYNLGRVFSYTLIGGIIGGASSVIAISVETKAMIIIVASILMLLIGLKMANMLPKFLNKFLLKKYLDVKIDKKTPFKIGIMNGFMPCGPLQAMQLYALSTGSFILGALSMFTFSIGTFIVMYLMSFIIVKIKGRKRLIMNRLSTSLIIILSLVMLNRGLALIGKDIKNMLFKVDYSKYEIAEIKGDTQYVEIELEPDNYKPIIIQKGIKVVFNIKGPEYTRLYGCTNIVIFPKLNIEKELEKGDNIIKFKIDKTGKINFTCHMGMVKSHILVVDDLDEVKNAK